MEHLTFTEKATLAGLYLFLVWGIGSLHTAVTELKPLLTGLREDLKDIKRAIDKVEDSIDEISFFKDQ